MRTTTLFLWGVAIAAFVVAIFALALARMKHRHARPVAILGVVLSLLPGPCVLMVGLMEVESLAADDGIEAARLAPTIPAARRAVLAHAARYAAMGAVPLVVSAVALWLTRRRKRELLPPSRMPFV